MAVFFFPLFFFSLLFVIINFNCSITVCISLALLEKRHSECEMVNTGSFFFIYFFFLLLHRGTGKALLWFTSSLTLALCFPECHRHHSAQSAIALCQYLVAMTTHSDYCAKRRHHRRLVRHPLSLVSYVPTRCRISMSWSVFIQW